MASITISTISIGVYDTCKCSSKRLQEMCVLFYYNLSCCLYSIVDRPQSSLRYRYPYDGIHLIEKLLWHSFHQLLIDRVAQFFSSSRERVLMHNCDYDSHLLPREAYHEQNCTLSTIAYPEFLPMFHLRSSNAHPQEY